MSTTTPLTPEVIATVKATSPVLAAHGTDITTTFYHIMFSQYPEVRTNTLGRGASCCCFSFPPLYAMAVLVGGGALLWTCPFFPSSPSLSLHRSGSFSTGGTRCPMR